MPCPLTKTLYGGAGYIEKCYYYYFRPRFMWERAVCSPKKKKNKHIKKGIFQKPVKILNTAANLCVVKKSVEQHVGGEEWADLGQIYDI